MGIFKKSMKDPVRGTARVVSASMPPGGPGESAMAGTGHCNLVVEAEGMPATAVTYSGLFRTKRWPMPGQVLPVTVDRANPERIKIHWDEVPSGRESGARDAQALAALMNARKAQQGQDPTSSQVAGLSEAEAAKVNEALSALGLGGIGSGQVIDLRSQSGGSTAAGTSDQISQIERLAALHKAGALTDEEFEQQKRRVLGGA